MTKVLKKLPRKASPVKVSQASNGYQRQSMNFWFSDDLEDWFNTYKVDHNRKKHATHN